PGRAGAVMPPVLPTGALTRPARLSSHPLSLISQPSSSSQAGRETVDGARPALLSLLAGRTLRRPPTCANPVEGAPAGAAEASRRLGKPAKPCRGRRTAGAARAPVGAGATAIPPDARHARSARSWRTAPDRAASPSRARSTLRQA